MDSNLDTCDNAKVIPGPNALQEHIQPITTPPKQPRGVRKKQQRTTPTSTIDAPLLDVVSNQSSLFDTIDGINAMISGSEEKGGKDSIRNQPSSVATIGGTGAMVTHTPKKRGRKKKIEVASDAVLTPGTLVNGGQQIGENGKPNPVVRQGKQAESVIDKKSMFWADIAPNPDGTPRTRYHRCSTLLHLAANSVSVYKRINPWAHLQILNVPESNSEELTTGPPVTWPQSSPMPCWNCEGEFEGPPVLIPAVYDVQTKIFSSFYGNFCKVPCAKRWLADSNHQEAPLHQMYLQSMATRVFRIPVEQQLEIAPAKCRLKRRGGDLTVEEYRLLSRSYTFDIVREPLFTTNWMMIESIPRAKDQQVPIQSSQLVQNKELNSSEPAQKKSSLTNTTGSSKSNDVNLTEIRRVWTSRGLNGYAENRTDDPTLVRNSQVNPTIFDTVQTGAEHSFQISDFDQAKEIAPVTHSKPNKKRKLAADTEIQPENNISEDQDLSFLTLQTKKPKLTADTH